MQRLIFSVLDFLVRIEKSRHRKWYQFFLNAFVMFILFSLLTIPGTAMLTIPGTAIKAITLVLAVSWGMALGVSVVVVMHENHS